MRGGICLPNYPIDQWSDKDKKVVDAARPAAVTLMAREHDRRAYAYLEAAAAGWGYKPLYVVRFGDGPQTPDSAAQHLDAALAQVPPAVLAEGRALFRLGNNTDKQKEWGDLGAYSHAFKGLHERRPTIPLVTTNLHDPGRWPEIAECAEYAAGLGAELYGQNGDPAQIQALIDTGKPIHVVETGSLLYHALQRVTWWEWRLPQFAALGFASVCWFIAGGRSYGAWDEGYILSEDEAAGLGKTNAALMAPPVPVVLPTPAPVPIVPANDPWLDAWGDLGGLRVRDVRAHFPELGGQFERRDSAAIDEFVVHHSTGGIPGSAQGSLTLLRSIDRYHRESANFSTTPGEVLHAPCIVYGLAVDDRDAWWVNGLEIVGWAQGPHNARGLACVWLGDYSDREPSAAVLAHTVAAWRAAEAAVGHPLTLVGHQEAMPGATICPSRLWPQIKARLLALKGGTVPAAGFDYEEIKNELDAIYATANEIEADAKRRADGLRAWAVAIKEKTGGEGR